MANNNHVRGDDDVFALLNEMSAGGGTTSSLNATSSTASPANNADDKIINPSNNNNEAYNALVSAHQLSPPSNPHIEIIRHRTHEKFKRNFYDLVRNCCCNVANNTHHNNNPTSSSAAVGKSDAIRSTIYTIWSNMPPHSIWERFQFSLKTLEADCVREAQQQYTIQHAAAASTGYVVPPPWCQTVSANQQQQPLLLQQLLNPSIHQIQSWIIHGKNMGIVWEPLLPVNEIITSSDSLSFELQQINARYRNEVLQLLQEEIKFQMTRTFKQLIKGGSGGRGKRLSLDKLFASLHQDEGEGGEGMNDYNDTKKQKKKKKLKKEKKKNKSFKDDDMNKEEYILHQVLFTSNQFQRIMTKLHKRFLYLADETYHDGFMTEVQKCCNRLLLEEQTSHSGGGGGGGGGKNKKRYSKKRKRNNNGGGGIPKVTFVENDYHNNNDDDDDDGDYSRKKKKKKSGSANQDEQQRQLMVTFAGISLRINEVHKNKLYALYQRTLSNLSHGNSSSNNTHDTTTQEYLAHFPKLLFTILLRYDALEGAGLQSAIPPAVFHWLYTSFECQYECFASPFNCWVEGLNCNNSSSSDCNNSSSSAMIRGGNFGSAFGDVDSAFGSRGSFFGSNMDDFVNMARKKSDDGASCFQANPPFASEFIEKMCHRMHSFLSFNGNDADDSSDMQQQGNCNSGNHKAPVPLMFVIFIPAWTASSGWKALSSSPYMTRHILLNQKEDSHYYAEGTQHRRSMDETHRIASFDTSVFFLQNDAAKRKWPLLDDDDGSILKKAFATKPDSTSLVYKKEGSHSDINIQQPAKEMSQQINTAIAVKQKKKKKQKETGDKNNNQGRSKKQKLIGGRQDEMSILKSMGIL